MRNLKKFLALALAMMMTLSLMVTANASKNVEFKDDGEVTAAFQEDLTVLAGMGIIQGHGDTGNFAPKSNVTRAQMAAIVYRLVTGDSKDARQHLYKGYGNFSDVDTNAWFAGYVGYCANQGIIVGYPDGTFRPFANVTGYAALTMILRAMGYNEPGHKFEGGTWKTEVSSTATLRGMLNKINQTVYGATLDQAAPRELVAEMAFQGATKAQVQWTTAFGYQTTGMTGGVTGSTTNPSLGWQNYGLQDATGIIVGNQATGESSTRISYAAATTGSNWERLDPNTVYDPFGDYVYAYGQVSAMDANGDYQGVAAAAPAINVIQTYDAETGLDLFGHAVNVWFDYRSAGTKTTYATFDRATKTAIVKADDGNLANGLGLGGAVSGKGFVNVGSAYLNTAYDRFTGRYASYTAGTNDSPDKLYALVSNSGTVLDVVVALNIDTTQISYVDNVSSVKTVGFPITTPAVAPDFVDPSQVNQNAFAPGAGMPDVATIEQGALKPVSTSTLRDYVIGYHVDGTNGTYNSSLAANDVANVASGYRNSMVHAAWTENAYFVLDKVDAPIQAVVTAYDGSKLVLADGRTLNKSILYDTVVDTTIPQQTSYQYGAYNIWLDDDGNFLGAAPVVSTNFIYGTYLDYTTEVNTGLFNYTLTGVGLDGKIITIPAKSLNGTAINGTDVLGVPYRDTWNSTGGGNATNGIGAGKYTGFTYGNGALSNGLATAGVLQGNNGVVDRFNDNGELDDGTATGAGDIYMGSRAKFLGAVKAGTTHDEAGTPIDLYFTESTQFYLVSGYGTATLKVEPFKGITALLNGAGSATINFQKLANATLENATYSELTYFTESPFTYSQTGVRGKQVDTIILPAAAVTRSSATSLYYVGNSAETLINANDNATQFTMWVNGESGSYWIEGLVGTAGTSAEIIKTTGHDRFYQLSDTGRKANDGRTIYTITPDSAGVKAAITDTATNNTVTQSIYTATTTNAQTANFGISVDGITLGMANVASAKIANVNATRGYAATWPNVNNLATLNDAGSLNQYVGAQTIKVSAVLNPSNYLIVDYIYVCYQQ